METWHSAARRPEVSIIIPARNEEASLAACLESLLPQVGVAFEIIVVDDHSTDRTRDIVASFAPVRAVTAPALPDGWTGKNNALVAGVNHARGAWLLFTDADTVHRPGSLARSLEEVRREGAALLSYSPEQEVHGFWEKALMPVIFAELARTYPPTEVSHTQSQAAAANGQYILIAREAYTQAGGHAAVATDLLEDVALARAVKQAGYTICFRYGSDAVRTRMYRSFAQLREGWTKNLAMLFARPLRLAALRMLEFALICTLSALALSASVRGNLYGSLAAVILSCLLYALFLRRIRSAHFACSSNLLAVFGLPIFSYLLWRSRVLYQKGNIAWKGRVYGTPSQAPVGTWPAIG